MAVKFGQDVCNNLCCHFAVRILGFNCFVRHHLDHELILVQDFEFQSPKVQRVGVSSPWVPLPGHGGERSFTSAEESKACQVCSAFPQCCFHP